MVNISSICVFSVFVWTGENYLKTLRVDVNFLKTEKKVAFSNENRYVWAGPKTINHRLSRALHKINLKKGSPTYSSS